MTNKNTLERVIFNACEHLAELGEYIDNATLSIELSDNITINVVSNATSQVTVFHNEVVAFNAFEYFSGDVEVSVLDAGDWVNIIISEFDALTTKTKRS